MKKLFLLACLSFIFFSHNAMAQKDKAAKPVDKQGKKESNIPYTIAKNYFVKNTYVPGSLKNPKIESEAAFNDLFGAAAYMGADGKPTAIDFSKEYVIAVIPNATSNAFTLTPVSLQKKGVNILLSYSYKEGEKLTYSSQPSLLVVVDKKYAGTVKLVKK
ncbi:MAG: hypothetical protein ACOVQE_08355 [Chitinophagaceae bacterium]